MTTGSDFTQTFLEDVKALAVRVESLEKVTNGETIIMPDGTEYQMGDFGYTDTAINVYVQNDAPTGLNSSTNVGDRWYDSDNGNALYAWDGFQWILISAGEVYHGGLGLESLGPALESRSITSFTIHVQGTAPGSPTHGTIWKDTASGNAIKYWDSTGGGTWETVSDNNTIAAVNNALAHPTADVTDNQLTVFYQISAPGGRNATTHRGDKWYDIDDRYQEYTWDGSSWLAGDGTLEGPATDGNPPASSPTATVRPGIGSLFVTWPAISNADPIWYNLYVSTTTPVVKDSSTFVGQHPGTFTVIQKLPNGNALLPATTYYVKLVAVDADGPAPDGTEGSSQISLIDINQFEASVKEDIEKIDTIQTTADGKNTVYYQTTMPTGGTYKLNDLWFDTDDSYKPYRYNGSTFDAFQFGTAALAALSVTTGVLAAGAVTADKVSANSISADALMIGSLGTSLVMNPSFELDANADSVPDAWYKSEGSGTGGFDRVALADAPDGAYVLGIQPNLSRGVGVKAFPVTAGKTYAIRYKIRATGTAQTFSVGVNWLASAAPTNGQIFQGARTGISYVQQNTPNHTAWVTYTHEWVAPATAEWASLSFVNESTTDTLYVDDTDMREQAISVMIANGAIVANKIGALAIESQHLSSAIIQTEHIDANAAWIGTMTADHITSGTLNAAITLSGVIKTADSGRRVVNSIDGVTLFDSSDNPLVELTTDANKQASFKGAATMTVIDIETSLSMQNYATMTVGNSAIITLGSQGSAPGAPTVAVTWPTVTQSGLTKHSQDPGNSERAHAMYYEGTQKWWWHTSPGAGAAYSRLWRANADGTSPTIINSISTSNTFWWGIARINGTGNYYFCEGPAPEQNSSAKVRQYDGINPYTANLINGYSVPSGETLMGIDTDSTYVYVLTRYNAGNLVYRPRIRRLTSSLTVSQTYDTTSIQVGASPYSWGLAVATSGVIGGSAPYFIFADSYGGSMRVCYATGGNTLTELTNQSFIAKSALPVSVAWDGTNVRTISDDITASRILTEEVHSGYNWTTEGATWWAGAAYKDTNATGGTGESKLGAVTSFTARRRAWHKLTMPTLNPLTSNDPNAYAFFLGRNATLPTNSAMWRQTPDEGTGVISKSIQTPLFSGTNPLTTSTLPGAVPGKLQSGALRADGSPMINLSGDGAANVDGLIHPGMSLVWWSNNAVPYGWYECDGGTASRTLDVDLYNAIGTTFGVGNGSTTFNLPDTRSRFILGKGALKNLGDNDGRTDDGTLNGRNPLHNHTLSGNTGNYVMADIQNTATGGTAGRLQGTAQNITHNHSLSGSTGTNVDGSIPYLTGRWIIKW